ncbi:MAG: PaaX family transcriptional regulator C-terminal domain-containing protein [Bosea sp. (in: a-proteobacteria)]
MTHGFALRALVDAFHARSPVRTWSLIVTVFGVVALPGSRALKLSDLQDWLGACGIEPGLVRTALSRLVTNGTLLRERDGKAALYRLSSAAEAEFQQAAQLIYGPLRPEPTGWLELALIENGHARKDARTILEAQGFVALAGGTMVRAEHKGRALADHNAIIQMRAEAGAAIARRTAALWQLGEIAQGYAAVSQHADALVVEAGQLSPDEKNVARILLVHEFRRVILRDPFLPDALLPPDWSGPAARKRFDVALAALGAIPDGG